MVAAYNEEKHLEEAVIGLNNVLKNMFKQYEILIFDDCSKDKTPEIADNLSKINKRIKVIHNKVNKGLGYNYRKALELAKYDYFSFIPGDNGVKSTSVGEILSYVGTADIIIPYTANTEIRSLDRRVISSLFTISLNFLFGLNLKYYNGIVVHKTDILRKIKMNTNSFAYQAESLIKLLKKGHLYKEIPMYINIEGKSSIFKLNNVKGVITSIINIFFEVKMKSLFRKRTKYKNVKN